MQILVICPANVVTGGPDALHALVGYLNDISGVDARIWYWRAGEQDPCPAEYKHYDCEYVLDIPDDFNGCLIFPEIWANEALNYPEYVRAVWWLGVDSYARFAGEACGAFLKDNSIIHLAPSEYATQFLRQLGIEPIRLDETPNAEFYADYTEETRSDVILYNPAKMTPFMNSLMACCPEFNFVPIRGMTRQQIIDLMHHSKLYIDFGPFPGRERLPREAVLCGCCIITGKIGAAAYVKDLPHDYKYDCKEAHIWAIKHKMKHVLNHYDECRRDFNIFRQSLYNDMQRIPKQCKLLTGEFFHEIQRHHTGL